MARIEVNAIIPLEVIRIFIYNRKVRHILIQPLIFPHLSHTPSPFLTIDAFVYSAQYSKPKITIATEQCFESCFVCCGDTSRPGYAFVRKIWKVFLLGLVTNFVRRFPDFWCNPDEVLSRWSGHVRWEF